MTEQPPRWRFDVELRPDLAPFADRAAEVSHRGEYAGTFYAEVDFRRPKLAGSGLFAQHGPPTEVVICYLQDLSGSIEVWEADDVGDFIAQAERGLLQVGRLVYTLRWLDKHLSGSVREQFRLENGRGMSLPGRRARARHLS